jgi:hypothetical protein
MTITTSAVAANAILDAWETAIGVSSILKIRSGAAPTHVADASTGTVLATLALPSDWMSAASGGSKAKLGTWQDTTADATGTAGHYEITASDSATVHERGSITITGGGGDMTLDSLSITSGQQVTISSYTKSIAI